jgi:hypothetical protein
MDTLGPLLWSHLWLQPNGSRLSCGRKARGRKEAELPIELAGEGTQVFPPERPPASSAC